MSLSKLNISYAKWKLTRNFHTSSSCLYDKKYNGKRSPREVQAHKRWYDTKEAHIANSKWREPRKFKEITSAQIIRSRYEYTLGEDQKASWPHRRWYDPFYNKWVPMRSFEGEERFTIEKPWLWTKINEMKTTRDKLELYLNYLERDKICLEPFNKDIAKNASYIAQYITNTKYLHGLPLTVDSIVVDESFLENFKEYLNNLLQLQNEDLQSNDTKTRDEFCKKLVLNVFNYLSSSLKNSNADTEVDINPQNSMFWLRGRGDHHWTKTNLPFYYQTHDSPYLQTRTNEQIEAFTPWMDDFMLSGDVPQFDFHPLDLYMDDYKMWRQYRNTISPGIRLSGGDLDPNYQEALEQGKLNELPPPLYNTCSYGHTQFHTIADRFNVKDYEENHEHCDIQDQMEEHIKQNGILSGWTWNAAQAHFDGNWFDRDINKSYQSQIVITDGERISFHWYQLNTIAIDSHHAEFNQRRNICYGTEFMKLLETSEDGDVTINEDALKILIKVMKNRANVSLCTKEEIEKHNQSLFEQTLDETSSAIEDQVPLHLREEEDILAMKKGQKEEEKEEDIEPSFTEKTLKMFGLN